MVTAPTASEREKSLSELIKSKALHQLANTGELFSAISKLCSEAAMGEEEELRMVSLSQLGKISGVLKSFRKTISSDLNNRVFQPIPLIPGHFDTDAKQNIIKCISEIDQYWVKDYLTDFIISEINSEKSRKDAVINLIERTKSIEEIIESLEHRTRKTKKLPTSEQNQRRLINIVNSINISHFEDKTEVSDNFGKILNSYIKTYLLSLECWEHTRFTHELCLSCAELIHRSIKSNFLISFTPSTFDGYLTIKRIVDRNSLSKESIQYEPLIIDIQKSILTLAKQGIHSNSLMKILEDSCKDSGQFIRLTSSISEKNPDLSNDTKYWLKTHKTPKSSSLSDAHDSQTMTAEKSLALILVETATSLTQLENWLKDIDSTIEIFSPENSQGLKRCLSAISNIKKATTQARVSANLEIFGKTGEKTNFMPTDHSTLNNLPAAESKVTIIRPGVKKHNSRSRYSIVLKALVE